MLIVFFYNVDLRADHLKKMLDVKIDVMGVILQTKLEYLCKVIFFFRKLMNYLFQYFS